MKPVSTPNTPVGMNNSERTPLLMGYKEIPPSPTLHPHHNQHHSTTTTTATTAITTPAVSIIPPRQDTEDKVDGILFNSRRHMTERSSIPDKPHSKDQQAHHVGRVTPPHLYREEDLFSPPQNEAAIKVYTRRFWILGSFSFMAMFQCLMWNTWGPLSASVDAAFPGWGSNTVAMMGNWGTITFVLFVAPMCWVMSTHGLRVGALLCATLIAAGVVLRVVPLLFTSNATFFTVMCHVCAILVGISGTLIMAAPPLIAAVWFPPKERTTATAFGQVLNVMGNTGSYMEPLMVKEPSSPDPGPQEVQEIQADIKRLMYIWAAVGMVLMAVLYLYFPARPPMPPSLTSHVERLDFRAGVKMMARNRELLLVTVSYGLCLGAPSAWASVLNYSLYELGMSQNDAMWVGLISTFSSGLLALLVGRLTDLVYGHIKLSLLVFLTLDIACFYWFFLLTWGSIPVTTWQIYIAVLGGMSFNFATAPLFFEMAVEIAYPCSEVMVGGILTAVNNFVGLCFLFLFFLPFESYQWVTYVLLTTLGLCLIPFMFVKENYSRSNIDRNDVVSAYQSI